ncbi:hypothetical protein ABKA04_009002 [Annulohypoxylon sp. FPYF3050]
MDPSGPPQPSKSSAYEAQANLASSTPQEERRAQTHSHEGRHVAERVPPTQTKGRGIAEATPSSLGYGILGAPAGEERFGRTQQEVGRGQELEGEQMRAPGEGDVAGAVERKPGAGGEQPDLAGDLERKKNEQAAMREEMKERRRHGEAPDSGDVRAEVGT